MTSIGSISNTNNDYNTIAAQANSTQTSDKNSTAKKHVTEYSDKTSLGLYFNSVPSEKANPKDIFRNLSLDVGGDGKSITKAQLDKYVDKAEDGKINIPDKELSALQKLQDNWDKVADGGDKITYANVSASGFTDTLKSMIPDKESKTKDLSSDFEDSKTKINNRLMSSALGSSVKSSSSNSYSSMLKTLLSGTTDENDDSNAEAIATLTNLIADSKSTSTTEVEA